MPAAAIIPSSADIDANARPDQRIVRRRRPRMMAQSRSDSGGLSLATPCVAGGPRDQISHSPGGARSSKSPRRIAGKYTLIYITLEQRVDPIMVDKMSFKERILEHIVADVPDELAPCEFDCPMQQCLEDDWKHCGNRLKMVEAIQSRRAAKNGQSS